MSIAANHKNDFFYERLPSVFLIFRCRNGFGRPGKIFVLNLCQIYSTYCSGVPGIFLQLILDCFRGLMQKKNSLLGEGSPISLDYAKFLGTSFAWTFSFVLCLDCFPILCRCIFEYISFSTYFYYLFSQPDFNQKSLLPLVATFLDLHVVLLRLGMWL